MLSQLPALQVVIPLIAAPLCVVFRNKEIACLVSQVVSILSFIISLILLQQVLEVGVISYALGGWLAPIGIEYRIDILNSFVLVIVTGISSVVTIYSNKSVQYEIDTEKIYLFYTGYLLMFSGLLGMTITGDAFNVFVFIEISSLSSYAMIAMGRDRRAVSASFTYLVMGTVGATFFLIGVGLMYSMTGTLNMADLAERLPKVYESKAILVSFAFISIGILLKLALFPLHLWLPNAYTYAPSVVSAFLSATATKVAIYILIRFGYSIFGSDFVFSQYPTAQILASMSIVAIVVCSLVAIFQTNIKRLLAFSSLAQVGYIILGVSFNNINGLTAAIVHIFNHALSKGALFLAMGSVALVIGSVKIKDINGLGKKMPFTSFAIVIGGLSLIGVPITAGFISKWYLILGAIDKGWWPLAIILLLTSLLALVYVWRIVEVMYFRSETNVSEVKEAPISMLIPMYILVAMTIYFGLETSFSAGLAKQAATYLLGMSG
ncbi:MAG: Na(+)/H(+) antiporter subunit D1 [Alphaproteobacteria bacterium MarineAlpha2_Bin1]|nr:MAG: Na(+)/H(+) antiporter subunit D1 [Alphaproteobacteria bacterium MarineAlpha2_Bin1]